MKIKIYLAILVFALSSVSLNAQEEEEKEMKYIFGGNGKTKVSGFIAPIMQFSAIEDEFAFLMGGGGAVLLNQQFYVGAFGEGLTTRHNNVNPEVEVVYPDGKTSFGYGGFWLGYIHQSQKPIHFGASTRFGWGSIYYDQYYKFDDDNFQTNKDLLDNVFVLVPQVEVEFNFFKWMKMNVGVGYRIVTGVNKIEPITGKELFDQKDFNKPQGTITLMFGYFK